MNCQRPIMHGAHSHQAWVPDDDSWHPPYSGVSTNYNEDTLLFSMSQQLFCADTTIQSYSLQNDFSIHICPFRTTTCTTFIFASTLNQSCFTVSVLFNFRRSRLLLRLSFPFDISFSPLWFASHFRLRILSCSFLLIQFNSAVIQNPDVTILVPMASVK